MLVKWSPASMQREVDEMWRDVFSYPSAFISHARQAFRVDVSEDEKNIYLEADLAGVKKEDVSVSVENGTLMITAERKEEKTDEGRNYYRKERVYGSLSRAFTLGDNVNADAVDAKYDNGVLKIKLPKIEEAKKANKIEVK